MEKQNLNILPTGGVLPIIHCSQGDIGREFQIILYSEGIPYILDGTEDLTIDGKKADNNIFSYDLPSTTGSTITISTEEQMTTCAGDTVCEIRIFKGTTRIGTCNFILQVEEGPCDGTLSTSALYTLDAIRAELQQAVEDAESYNAQSKSWAVGPSGTGSGTDTNNSKYYSEQSSNSATSSANSANASSSSATDSKNWAVGPSGSGSGTDTNNSKYYSQQSANSASDSSDYATNSQNSANASAGSATDSKNWAVGPSGSGSGTDTNNAKYYSDQSSNSATNASNSANSASSSATDSKNWAVGPSGSGSGTDSNNAKYYSEQGANSATSASNSAIDSKNWAVGPSGSGSGTDSNNSKYYAEQSANSATSASNSASAASSAQSAIENMTASATQLAEGATPTVTKTTVGGVVNLNFGIPKGDTGSTGPQGPEGPMGPSGGPLIAGGTTGQVLAKASDTDYDAQWVNHSGGYTKPNRYQNVNFFVSAGLATVTPPTGSGRVVATGNKCWNSANTLEFNEYAFNFKLSPNSSDTDVEKIQIGFNINNYIAYFHSGEVNVYWWDSVESQFVALDYAIKGSGPTPSDNPCYIIATLPEMQNIDSTNILWVSGKAYVRS